MSKTSPWAWLPNTLTAGNLVSGFLASAWALGLARQGEPMGSLRWELCGWLVLLATLFDALDGAAARRFGSAGDLGMRLDSFADSVTFGLAPAAIMGAAMFGPFGKLGWVAAALYFLCAVVRLARYNIISGTTKFGFVGLPSPGAALLVVAAFMALHRLEGSALELARKACLALTAGAGLLMVSGLPFCGIKGLSPIEKRVAMLLLIAAAALVPWLGIWGALLALMLAYTLVLGWAWALLRHRFIPTA